MATVTGKVGCSSPIMVDAFSYLKEVTGDATRAVTAKVTIPSPSMLYMRGGRKSVSSAVYPDLAEFWQDVAAAYRGRSDISPIEAAPICSWTMYRSPIYAIRSFATAAGSTATIRKRCRAPLQTQSTPRYADVRPA